MSTFQSFSCTECGHAVKLAVGRGRTREYVTGYQLDIPDDFEIPTCVSCGETYMSEELSERLDAVLRKQFLKVQSSHYRELIDILIQRHGVTQKDIVRACAITPSYLSHVIAGKRQASTTLTRLLEAFVADNGEFDRHVHGRPWKRTLGTVPLYAVKTKKWCGVAPTKQEWHQADAPANDCKVEPIVGTGS